MNNLVYFLGCVEPVTSLINISSHASCHIPGSCMAVDCCVTMPSFRRDIHVLVDLDPCEFTLIVEIERVHLSLPLMEYKWGSLEEFSLLGVVGVKYVYTCTKTEKSRINYQRNSNSSLKH